VLPKRRNPFESSPDHAPSPLAPEALPAPEPPPPPAQVHTEVVRFVFRTRPVVVLTVAAMATISSLG
jgi:hypothetical protein